MCQLRQRSKLTRNKASVPQVHAAASSGGEPKWTSSLLGDVQGVDLHPERSDGCSIDNIGVDHELVEFALLVGPGEVDEHFTSFNKLERYVSLNRIHGYRRGLIHFRGVLSIGRFNVEWGVIRDDLLSVSHFFFIGATSKIISGDLDNGRLILDLSQFFGRPGRHLVWGDLRFGFDHGSWSRISLSLDSLVDQVVDLVDARKGGAQGG